MSYPPPAQSRRSNAAVWWTLGIVGVVIIALVIGCTALVGNQIGKIAADPDGPRPQSDAGTHLTPQDGDLKIGHNRAVNACNVMPADLVAEYFGTRSASGDDLREAYVESDVSPFMMRRGSTPLHEVSRCDRHISDDYGDYGTAVASLTVDAYANAESAGKDYSRVRRTDQRMAQRNATRTPKATRSSPPNDFGPGTFTARTFTAVNDSTHALQRQTGTSQKTTYIFVVSSYQLTLQVVTRSATTAKKVLTGDQLLDRAGKLTAKVVKNVTSTGISTRPTLPQFADEKSIADPCEAFTAADYRKNFLAPRSQLSGPAAQASPLVANRMFALMDGGPSRLGRSAGECRRTSGMELENWSDLDDKAKNRQRSRVKDETSVTFTSFDDTQLAKKKVQEMLDAAPSGRPKATKLDGLGDFAAMFTTSSSSLERFEVKVVKGTTLVHVQDAYSRLTADSLKPLPREQQLQAVKTIIDRLP